MHSKPDNESDLCKKDEKLTVMSVWICSVSASSMSWLACKMFAFLGSMERCCSVFCGSLGLAFMNCWYIWHVRRCRVKPEGVDDVRAHWGQHESLTILHSKIEMFAYEIEDVAWANSLPGKIVWHVATQKCRRKMICTLLGAVMVTWVWPKASVYTFGKGTSEEECNISWMGCIAWMGLDGNLQVSESVTLSRKRPKVQRWRMKKEPRDQATCAAHTDKKHEFVSKFSHNVSIPLHFSPPMAVQSNQSHGSQSSPSSGYLGNSSPWDRRDSSPLPGNGTNSHSQVSDFMNTQDLRAGVLDLMDHAVRNARQCSGASEDLVDVELRPSKRRCGVIADV